MNRDAFEQLINDWLDADEKSALREQIDHAITESPELKSTWDEWLRFADAFDRVASPKLPVDWDKFQAHVSREVHDEVDRLDEALDTLPDIEGRVDWDKFHSRVSTRIHIDRRQRRLQRVRWSAVGSGLVAAAAVLLVMFYTPSPKPNDATVPTATGSASITVVGNTSETTAGFAHVSITPMDEMPIESETEIAKSDMDILIVDPAPDPSNTDVDLALF